MKKSKWDQFMYKYISKDINAGNKEGMYEVMEISLKFIANRQEPMNRSMQLNYIPVTAFP